MIQKLSIGLLILYVWTEYHITFTHENSEETVTIPKSCTINEKGNKK